MFPTIRTWPTIGNVPVLSGSRNPEAERRGATNFCKIHNGESAEPGSRFKRTPSAKEIAAALEIPTCLKGEIPDCTYFEALGVSSHDFSMGSNSVFIELVESGLI